VVDEAWYFMQHGDTAAFLHSIAKRARKYYLGLTTITQDVEDFMHSDYGRAIVTNASIQLLLKQASAAIPVLAQTFYLSEGEQRLLMAADIGEGLFFAGQNHVAIRVIASPEEHVVITTDPRELEQMEAARRQQEMVLQQTTTALHQMQYQDNQPTEGSTAGAATASGMIGSATVPASVVAAGAVAGSAPEQLQGTPIPQQAPPAQYVPPNVPSESAATAPAPQPMAPTMAPVQPTAPGEVPDQGADLGVTLGSPTPTLVQPPTGMTPPTPPQPGTHAGLPPQA
jgi:hypothetical protein